MTEILWRITNGRYSNEEAICTYDEFIEAMRESGWGDHDDFGIAFGYIVDAHTGEIVGEEADS